MRRHIDYCNRQDPNNPQMNPKRAKWDSHLTNKLRRKKTRFDKSKIRLYMYRPFFKQWVYFDSTYNQEQPGSPSFFPKGDSKNLTICVPHKFTGEFYALVTDITPDLELVHHGQCFPFYRYDAGGKKDNITDATLSEYRRRYRNDAITKLDIFYYVYGLLHHPGYKKKFASNLIRELPRVPMAPDFAGFRNAGKKLAGLHVDFETCARHDLGRPRFHPAKFSKLSFAARKDAATGKSVKDKTTIRVDGAVLFDNVPETTYRVNGRTPLEWVVDRYKVTTDKDSGIANDPCTGTDVVAVIERAIHIGLESESIVKALPDEFESGDEQPAEDGLDKFTGGNATFG